MPELPEVETITRSLRPKLTGRRLTGIRTTWPKSLLPSVSAVQAAVNGQLITSVSRCAKLLIWSLDDEAHLLIHLRMSGRFHWSSETIDRPQHVRTRFAFKTGDALLFADARKFGRIILTRDLDSALATYGPEPLGAEFTARRFFAMLQSRHRALKPLLLDQSFLAGLGNIYTDEALFRSKLHPLTPAHTVSHEAVGRLYRAIRRTLREEARPHSRTDNRHTGQLRE